MQQLCYTSFLVILPDWLATIAAAAEVIAIHSLLLFVKTRTTYGRASICKAIINP